MLILVIFIFFTNCQENKATFELTDFFKRIHWNDFNRITFERNHLSHFLQSRIDFYQRESFFRFMKNSPEKIYYQHFDLFEIYESGERIINKKILIIKNGENISYLGFITGLKWERYHVSNKEKDRLKYMEVYNKNPLPDQSYYMITRVNGLKY